MTTPTFFQQTVAVLEHVLLAERTFRIRLATPEIAQRIQPGQFVMLRLPDTTDPLLGRPFALYDTVLDSAGVPIGIDIVYLVIGKMTGKLAEVVVGERLEVWGPLGRPFLPIDGVDQVNLVAGGIGQTPFLAYTRELLGQRGYGGQAARAHCRRVQLYYGVRTASLVAGVEDFRAAGAEVSLATDDGSLGHSGVITQLLEQDGPPGPIVACGPEPMLRVVVALAQRWQRSAQVSLETPMACGVGICFSCVTKVRQPDGSWDYQRVCVDGPVFDAAVWLP